MISVPQTDVYYIHILLSMHFCRYIFVYLYTCQDLGEEYGMFYPGYVVQSHV